MQETRFYSWVWKMGWRRHRLPIPKFMGFPGGSAGKESTCNIADLCSISGLGRSPGEGKGHPFQYSGVENSMDCIVHGVTKSRTQLRLSLSISCAQSLSIIQLFAYTWIAARQAPLSMGILHVGRLEWVAIPCSRGSSQPRGRTQVSCIVGRFFTD